MKKIFLIILAVLLASTACASGNNSEPETSAVIYFSATGNTESVAEELSSMLDIPLFEIEPVESYTAEDLDYRDRNSRTTLESNDASARPAIMPLDGAADFETIFIGFPIWNGDMPKVLYTFFDTYDFSGKTIIPFCTSGSTGISRAERNIANLEENAEVLSGRRINTGRISSDLASWLADIGIRY